MIEFFPFFFLIIIMYMSYIALVVKVATLNPAAVQNTLDQYFQGLSPKTLAAVKSALSSVITDTPINSSRLKEDNKYNNSYIQSWV